MKFLEIPGITSGIPTDGSEKKEKGVMRQAAEVIANDVKTNIANELIKTYTGLRDSLPKTVLTEEEQALREKRKQEAAEIGQRRREQMSGIGKKIGEGLIGLLNSRKKRISGGSGSSVRRELPNETGEIVNGVYRDENDPNGGWHE